MGGPLEFLVLTELSLDSHLLFCVFKGHTYLGTRKQEPLGKFIPWPDFFPAPPHAYTVLSFFSLKNLLCTNHVTEIFHFDLAFTPSQELHQIHKFVSIPPDTLFSMHCRNAIKTQWMNQWVKKCIPFTFLYCIPFFCILLITVCFEYPNSRVTSCSQKFFCIPPGPTVTYKSNHSEA